MKKYKTSTFYKLDDGTKLCISTDLVGGEAKLINMKQEVLKVVRYDKMGRLVKIMEDMEKQAKQKKL